MPSLPMNNVQTLAPPPPPHLKTSCQSPTGSQTQVKLFKSCDLRRRLFHAEIGKYGGRQEYVRGNREI